MFMRQSFRRGISAASKVSARSINPFLTNSLMQKHQRIAMMGFRSSQILNKPTGATQSYNDQMYQQWREDPASVDQTWAEHFGGSPAQSSGGDPQLVELLEALKAGGLKGTSGADINQAQRDGFKLMTYIRAFMTHGHLNADLDPLRLEDFNEEGVAEAFSKVRPFRKLIDIEFYGFTEADLDKQFYVNLPHWGGLLASKTNWTLREIKEALEKAYCNKIGVEYMHIPNREHCNWIRDQIELKQFKPLSKQEKLVLLDRLYWTDEFAQFIATKFNTMKRFGLEGCDSFIPGMKVAMDACVEHGAEKAVIGMPHRGRLNMLANVVRKPLPQLFAEFVGTVPLEDKEANWSQNTGDAKYHLGTSYTRTYPGGKELTVEVLANPSHLECINPVVMGRVRAKNHIWKQSVEDEFAGDRTKVIPFLIHGDAAFSGQGVVYESIQMQDLKNYTVGGTIHVIVNNQIGFTTVPAKGRSGMYCSDLAKSINAPIFHVNANSAEDVHHAFRVAAEYRQIFNHDVVIDLIGYRKYGHNELDQPSFTQPMMYKQVAKMESVARIYEKELLASGDTDEAQILRMKTKIQNQLEEAYQKSKTYEFKAEDWVTKEWDDIKLHYSENQAKSSGVEKQSIQETGLTITTLPADKNFHRLVKKIFDARRVSIETGTGIDWGTAEALAFATLLKDGYEVRLSGQDVERGTFSHRHAHVFYQDTDGYYNPINQVIPEELIKSGTRRFIASNSHLSEFAVLGYELGYAQTHPNTLTLWEAQFGDFANGAQVIIDQFISSGEAKWNVKNGLVMLLPHGYDGQGPEHSSCRTERYLLLCDQDEFVPGDGVNYDNKDILKQHNMQVVNPSTAANYFHLLRTQMRLPFRKPLIVVAPKKLLRLKGACSDLSDFTEGTRWLPLIGDKSKNLNSPDKVRKVILCSGQVYYDLESKREKDGVTDTAIIRCESLCPFPFKEIIAELKNYKNAEITWAQEEPKNAGSWTYVEPRLRNILGHLDKPKKVKYAGRRIMGATAVGFTSTHNTGLSKLLEDAFE